MAVNAVQQFYDQLATTYHHISQDWHRGVRWQGEVLSRLIHQQAPDAKRILDCSCGIGTQAIGLALQGYAVHATDLSPDAVARATAEARTFGVSLTTGVADLRTLDLQVDGMFDIVLSCDNSVAHLLTEDDLISAFRAMRGKTKPGGFALVSLRDYDRTVQDKPRSTLPVVSPDGSTINFQTWKWADDGKTYGMTMYTMRQDADSWVTTTLDTTLRGWQRTEVTAVIKRAGFNQIGWHMPEASGYYQPIVIAFVSSC